MSLVKRSSLRPGVEQLLLNDPESRNAMSPEMAAEFESAVTDLKARLDLKLVVLRGAGRAFSAGGHLDMLEAKCQIKPEENKKGMLKFYRQFLSIAELEVPVLAALNGHAVGAGLCVALACDFRIASAAAKLGLNFVRLGLHPGMGVTHFLPRLVGPARASELLAAGRIVPAEEGFQLGIVNAVVAADEFDAEVERWIDDILAGGPLTLRQLKQTLRDSLGRSLEENLQREAECQAENYAGAEFREGISAAKEKRPPKF